MSVGAQHTIRALLFETNFYNWENDGFPASEDRWQLGCHQGTALIAPDLYNQPKSFSNKEKPVVLGVVYFSYCNFIPYSNLCKCNPFLVFSPLITSVMCMEVVSSSVACLYKHFLILILLSLPLHSSCSLCMENAGHTMLLNPLFSPLPGSLFATSTPKPSSGLFYSSLPESSPQVSTECTNECRHTHIRIHTYIRTYYFHVDNVVYIISHLLP